MSNMKVPTNLAHKPIFTVENYNLVDGYYNPQTTDGKGLSIGIAQWSDRYNTEISAKVWRHTGEKWSRQSEELPLHRVLDLAILICSVASYVKERTKDQSLNVQGHDLPVEVASDRYTSHDINILAEFLEKHHTEILDSRFKELANKLKSLGY